MVISGAISPLIWVINMVTRIIAPLITTHEPPSTHPVPQAAKCLLTQAAMQLGQGSVGGASADFVLKIRGAVVWGDLQYSPSLKWVESGPSFSESPVCLAKATGLEVCVRCRLADLPSSPESFLCL